MNGKKYDNGKLRYDLVPHKITTGVAKIMTFGAKKYAPNTWQNIDDAEERYTAALMRHLYAHLDGELYDEESGLLHLEHLAANTAFLLHIIDRDEK